MASVGRRFGREGAAIWRRSVARFVEKSKPRFFHFQGTRFAGNAADLPSWTAQIPYLLFFYLGQKNPPFWEDVSDNAFQKMS